MRSRCLRQGCKRLAESYGFCQVHYVQFRRKEPQRYEWLRTLSKENRRFEIARMRAAERAAEKAKSQPPRWEYEPTPEMVEALAAQYGGQQDLQ